MTETPNVGLPLLQPSQAQKHVTVNEAFVLLDCIAQLSLVAIDQTDPPGVLQEGVAYGVPVGATGAWADEAGTIAIVSNGGWVFVAPKAGWRAWVTEEGRELQFDGTAWTTVATTGSASGAGLTFRTVETDVNLVSGGAQDLSVVIPQNAMVFAASSRVISEIAGDLTGWKLGTLGAENRFGSGMGPSTGSYGSGILGNPTTYYGDTPLRFTPLGGTVTGGQLRIALTYADFAIPGTS